MNNFESIKVKDQLFQTIRPSLLAFFLTYMAFFITPVFLNPQGVMFSKNAVPAAVQVGIDLKEMLLHSAGWFNEGTSPYFDNYIYPPLAFILFLPLTLFDFSTAYLINTVLTIVAYFLTTLFIPLWMSRDRKAENMAVVILFSVSGSISYGLQFELERGQFNTITFCLLLLSIYIFHFRERYRYLSYILITIAIQLKVWPLIFIILFVTDSSDWWQKAKRLFTILFMNFGCLFIMGGGKFLDCLEAIRAHAASPPYIWCGNHSIKSFSGMFLTFGPRVLPLGADNLLILSHFVLLLFSFLTLTCLIVVSICSFSKRSSGLSSRLFLSCALGACLIPSVSHDYKLPILSMSVMNFVMSLEPFPTGNESIQRWLKSTVIFVVSFGYSTTLYSYWYKPFFLASNTPVIMFMLIALAIHALVETRELRTFTTPPINNRIIE